MSKPIKTCVIGLGLGGLAFHVPFVLALPELFTLYAVLERNPTTDGGKVKQRFGVSPTKIHRSLEEVLEDPEIELVIVTTPNNTHYSFAKAVLEAGKHVLVDKPVSTTAAEARELGKIAASKSLVLYGFQNRRWDSDFLALKKLLNLPATSEHSLGNILDFESHFDRYTTAKRGNWKDVGASPGNGWVYDLGTHLIDQALTLFGRPDTITAFIQKVRGFETDDNFTIILGYNSSSNREYPLQAILRAHILSVKTVQPRFIVRGTKGTFTKNGVDIQEDQLKVMATVDEISQPSYGKEPESLWGSIESLTESGVQTLTWPSEEPGDYRGLFKNLAGAIRSGEKQAVTWNEATAVIEFVELAHQSAKEMRTIVVPK
ncbi:NAD(P)-binding protein [Flagelloscypha sp. PMI_526]|nr:NAD(P)-binding protein [Flagelloscypha sp. PMI_526]